jgi:ribose transport system substrate-binding protein
MTKAEDERREPSRKVDKYWVPIVARAIDLLDCFGSATESLTLEQAVKKTGIPHTTAYRILHTLVLRDYLTQTGREYRLNRLRKRLKFGFANLSKHVAVAMEIQESIAKATASAGIDLLVWDNNRNAEQAIQNAKEMADSKVDLAIEFQLFENVATVISDVFSRAEIPLISVVNPHLGTVYFGVNNYRAGLSAGTALAEFAMKHWKSQVDHLVLLESPSAGRTVQSRLVGAIQGIENRIGKLPEKAIHHLDGGGDTETSQSVVSTFLKRKTEKNVLVVGINDESAIGALRAAEQATGDLKFAVVGHGGSAEIAEMVADRDSPCIGTVAFHTERYGPDLLTFALPIVRGKSAPIAHYVPHEFWGKPILIGGRSDRSTRRSS